MYLLYRSLTYVTSLAVPVLLRVRRKAGKEDVARMGERLGHASKPRPAGRLVWIHAASVGESNAVLPLIDALLAASSDITVLLTTVTVTSADLMGVRLPSRAIHQFAPVDTPQAVARFLNHWQPDVALWVDSELWPNLIIETHKRGAFMGIINARLSERSFNKWKRVPSFIARMLSCFALCFAQSEEDGARLKALGIRQLQHIGNLKYDAPALPADEKVLGELRMALGGRPTWLAASTHPGEERMIAEAHLALKAQGMKLLTIIVPRHAVRGEKIATELQPLAVALRSKGDPLTQNTDVYLADTMGELGLFYRLSPIAFIGGSLVAHGGQNPLEAARLGTAVLLGPHMENFETIVKRMQQDKACLSVTNTIDLAVAVKKLITSEPERKALAAAGLAHVKAQSGVVTHIMNELQGHLA